MADLKKWRKRVDVKVEQDDYPEMLSKRVEWFIQERAHNPQFQYQVDIKAVPYTVYEYQTPVTAFKYVAAITVTYNEPDV